MEQLEPESPGPVVVVGASAGGVQELSRFVSLLPEDDGFVVLVVLHLSPRAPSVLAEILGRRTSWPVKVPREGEPIRSGHVYVAPPDQHLVVADGHLQVNREPRENGHRPALDTTMRSVARTFGPAGAAVVLSGTGGDGSLGASAIKLAGGRVFVEDPEASLYGAMPRNAIDATDVDVVGTLETLVKAVVAFVGASPAGSPGASPESTGTEPTRFVCPDCGGVLVHERLGGAESWVCRTGHRYSPEDFEEEQRRHLESALWAAVRSLEERADLLRRLAHRAHGHGNVASGTQMELQAAEADDQARQVRAIVSGPVDVGGFA